MSPRSLHRPFSARIRLSLYAASVLETCAGHWCGSIYDRAGCVIMQCSTGRMARRREVPMDDMQLLQQYAQSGCQDSFERLVRRHIDWVYSVCLRGVKDRHLAEDVTQAVFIILARKSKSLSPDTILRGWLFKAARFAVADTLKKQNRHRRHVQRAAEMGPVDPSAQETATQS